MEELYKSAKGKTFYGEVVEPHQIHKKEWTVIEITGGASNLKKILKNIHPLADGKVWKGFTGPPDYDNYRLWVELDIGEGVSKNFTVTGYKGPFRVADAKYSHRKGYCFVVE